MRVRLRDYVETGEGLIFSVVGYDTRGGIPGLLRYIPDPVGERVSPGGRRYRKMGFEEAFRWMESRHPGWVERVHRVPPGEVARVHRPPEGLQASGDRRVKRLERLLGARGLGLTGSHLLGLAGKASDIDLVAYGADFGRAQGALRRALARGTSRGTLRPLGEEHWREVYGKRRPSLGFEEFVAHEMRKGNRGVIAGTRFDLLFTRSWPQARRFRDWRGTPGPRKTLRARVVEVEYPHDIPTVYRLDHPEVEAVMNFTHTYVDQVRPGELLEARGRLERRGGRARLRVGSSPRAPGEYIRSIAVKDNLGREGVG
ncbi:MAG: DNA polymerase subunit beta [Euryarchaeota archaeon]|nr:DNA polymerase subunit beta [Euryarchaeota archaeon]